jgi:hypothetical protein
MLPSNAAAYAPEDLPSPITVPLSTRGAACLKAASEVGVVTAGVVHVKELYVAAVRVQGCPHTVTRVAEVARGAKPRPEMVRGTPPPNPPTEGVMPVTCIHT